MSRARNIVQHEQRIGYWKGRRGQGDVRTFVPVANFAVRLLKFIQSPEEIPDFKGFLVEVSLNQKRREGEVIVKGCVNYRSL